MQTIDIPQIRKYASISDDFSLGNDMMMVKTGNGDNRLFELLRHPVRFDGYILYFLKKGSVTIDFDLGSFLAKEYSLLLSLPRNIIRIPPMSEEQMAQTDLRLVLLSKAFISGLHLDYHTTSQESLRIMEQPSIILAGEQLEIAGAFFRLAKQVLRSNQNNKKLIIGGLVTSLNYLIANIWEEQLNQSRKQQGSTRTHQVLEQFLSLVTEYHTTERGMQFYADKLFLTPKYLSKIIKETSGRSGPEWIDAFVILEAKNMLRFSKLAIKEVVYALNFPNPSVFHKFFKAHTGMTPTEYRKES